MMYEFGDFSLNEDHQEIYRGNVEVRTPRKVFQTILYLLRNHCRVVTKQELLDAIWPNTAVTPASIARAIKGARRVLGTRGETPIIIKTIHGVGYRLVADVRQLPEGQSPQAHSYPGLSMHSS